VLTCILIKELFIAEIVAATAKVIKAIIKFAKLLLEEWIVKSKSFEFMHLCKCINTYGSDNNSQTYCFGKTLNKRTVINTLFLG